MDRSGILMVVLPLLALSSCDQFVTESCDFEVGDCQDSLGYRINTQVWQRAKWSESIADVPEPPKPNGPHYMEIKNIKTTDVPMFIIPFETGNGTIEMDIFIQIYQNVPRKQAGIVRLQQGPAIILKQWNNFGTNGKWQHVSIDLQPTNVTSKLNVQLTVQRSYRSYVAIVAVDNVVLTEWRSPTSDPTEEPTRPTTLIPITTTTTHASTTPAHGGNSESCDFSDVHRCDITFNHWQAQLWNYFPVPVPNRGRSFLGIDVTQLPDSEFASAFVDFVPSVSPAGKNFTLSYFVEPSESGLWIGSVLVVKQGPDVELIRLDWRDELDAGRWVTVTVPLVSDGKDQVTLEFGCDRDKLKYVALDYVEITGVQNLCRALNLDRDYCANYGLWTLDYVAAPYKTLAFRPSSHTPEQVEAAFVSFGLQTPLQGNCLTISLYVELSNSARVSDRLIAVTQGSNSLFNLTATDLPEAEWTLRTEPLWSGDEKEIQIRFFPEAHEAIQLITIDYLEETACTSGYRR